MPSRPKPTLKPSRKPKPKAASNAINGNVSNSSFVQGENRGFVISGSSPEDLDKRLHSVTDRLSEEILSSLESK